MITEPVGAVLARDKGDAVCQAHRVIVLRGQARSYGSPKPVGARLARDIGTSVCQAYRAIVHREQARLLQMITEPVYLTYPTRNNTPPPWYAWPPLGGR